MPPKHLHSPNSRAQHGQTVAEYAILLSGIALVVVVSIPLLGSAIKGLFSGALAAFGGP
jgi:Flp pilus assembly pilin Flp